MIIDGKEIANRILDDLKNNNENKKLGIILASDDESSKVYVELKKEKGKKFNIESEVFEFDYNCDVGDVISKIDNLNKGDYDGILVQLPLYDHLKPSTNIILNSVLFSKDVDGLTAVQQAKSSHMLNGAILPAAVEAVLESLNEVYEEDLTWKNIIRNHSNIEVFNGMNIVIVNNSNLLGKPLSQVLTNLGATVTIANEHTRRLKEYTLNADIIVSGTGKTKLIDSDMVKEDSVLIDVTSSRTDEGVLGDFVLDDEMKAKVKAYTPVPGGVGPVTVACLMRNISNI